MKGLPEPKTPMEHEIMEVLDRIEKEHDALYEKYRREGGLDGHTKEHKAITQKGFAEIAKIKKKYRSE